MDSDADFLFARPSFIEGIARQFDFGNALSEYNYSFRNGQEADTRAIAADWSAVGDYLRDAVRQVEQERYQDSDAAVRTI